MRSMTRAHSSPSSKQRHGGVPVSVRALEQRVSRRLAIDGKLLKRTRGELALRDLGTAHYVLGKNNSVVPINLEALGREIGALADYERLFVED
jgi:hypothetical protein